jgi:MFS family permease
MIEILKNPTYAKLFSAQVIALLGTGLLTVALGLLAYDMAGAAAGTVLGTAYAIKMVAYVGLSPVAAAMVEKLPRKAVLIGADLIRAAVALGLPFIDAIWQVYVLIFVLQAASATFTPAFQAVIPDILEDEANYTRALSLSRMAYDLENLVSPMLAGLLLSVISYHWLFGGTVLGFVGSALLVSAATIPAVRAKEGRSFGDRLTRGLRIYLATPRLRGLLALTLSAASASAFVLVNTVVIVRVGYEASDRAVALALACYGGGSMVAALMLPRVLTRLRDRQVMMFGAVMLVALLGGAGALVLQGSVLEWRLFLGLWALLGLAYAAVLTPAGRLLRNSAHSEDRPAVFVAQFALSHACWLLTYPLAGWAGQALGMGGAFLVLAAVAAVGVAAALVLWPHVAQSALPHVHPDLRPDHPHVLAHRDSKGQHRHAVVIDDEHRVWPTQG